MIQKILNLLQTHPTLIISLKITPKSQNNQIIDCLEQLNGQILLKLKIKGAPEKGQVNQETINFLSKQLNLAKSKLQFIAGLTSRNKILKITR